MRMMLPVKWQKDHYESGFFHKQMEIIGQAILQMAKCLKLIYQYENDVTSQMAKRSL